jgi:Lon protease-like protein
MDIVSSERLDELPLFPLATVLFPGAILPLHIFEERYKELMRYAIENGGVFGLSYRNDAAIGRETLPDVGSVGCVAQINAVMPLDEGKMNIISTGAVRYRVAQLKQVVPFLIARVNPFQDEPESESELDRLFTRIRLTRLRHYVTAALSSYSERLKIQDRAKSNGHGKLQ